LQPSWRGRHEFSCAIPVCVRNNRTILTARVPVHKIVFFNTLLPVHPLKGEGEYLVIGGEYRVTASTL
jgi:hypothetical protein